MNAEKPVAIVNGNDEMMAAARKPDVFAEGSGKVYGILAKCKAIYIHVRVIMASPGPVAPSSSNL